MHAFVLLPALAFVLILASVAQAQNPAPAAPYKAVPISPPPDLNDPALAALRGQLAEAAKKRDAATLARLTVTTGFFWARDNRDFASKRKSGFDNLSAALGLTNKDAAGWDILAGYADDPTVSPSPGHKGAFCAPAMPSYDAAALDRLLKATHSDIAEWGYPVSANIEVHATAQANAPVIEKLGLYFVRVTPDAKPTSAAYQRIATPSGKTGYVSIDALAPIGGDQICYVKDSAGWKIAGYIGGGEPQ